MLTQQITPKKALPYSRKATLWILSFILAFVVLGSPLRVLLGNSQAEIIVFSLGLTGFFYANFLELPLKGKTLAGFYLILSIIQEVSIGNFPSAAWLTIPTNCVFLIIVFNLKQLHIGHDASRAVIIVALLASLIMALIQKSGADTLCYISDCDLRPNGLARSTFQLSTLGLCFLMIALSGAWTDITKRYALLTISIMIILASRSLGALLCGIAIILITYIHVQGRSAIYMLVALSIGSIILLMINIEYFHDFLSTGANSYRIYVYKHQLLSIIDNPFGTGVGTTGSIATNLNTDFRMDSESALLSYANEQGILGAIYIGVIFTMLFKKFSNTLQVFCYTSVILFLFTFQAFPKTPSTMLFILMTLALCQPKNKS